jgi:hypothetical protein
MVFIINACDRIDSMTKISVPELTDSNQIKIAIFEDDPLIRLGLKQFLSAQPQLYSSTARTGQSALAGAIAK